LTVNGAAIEQRAYMRLGSDAGKSMPRPMPLAIVIGIIMVGINSRAAAHYTTRAPTKGAGCGWERRAERGRDGEEVGTGYDDVWR